MAIGQVTGLLSAETLQTPGVSRWSPRDAWGRLLGVVTLASAALLLGQPILAIASLCAGLVWAVWEGVNLTWTKGIGFLFLVLQFVPSRIYRLPFTAAFDLDPYRLTLLALLVLWLIQSALHGQFPFRATYLDPAVGLFLFAVVLPYAMNATLFSSPSESQFMIKSTAYLLSFVATFYLVAAAVRSTKDAIAIVDVTTVLGAIGGMSAVVERFTEYNIFLHLNTLYPVLQYSADPSDLLGGGIRGAALRAAGPTAHPIAFATMLSMLLPLAVARALHGQSRRMRMASGICALGIGVGIFVALSRTGVVGLAVGGAVLLFGFPRHRKLLITACAGLVGAVHVAFRGVFGTLVQYFSPSFVLSQEVGNDNGRLADYARSLPDILNRPMFGRGFNTYAPERYMTFIDNQYLKFVLEIGIVGIAAFVFLIGRIVSVCFATGQRAGDETGAVLIGLSAAALVFGVTSATFDTIGFPQVAYLFFALAGLSAVIVRECRREAAVAGGLS